MGSCCAKFCSCCSCCPCCNPQQVDKGIDAPIQDNMSQILHGLGLSKFDETQKIYGYKDERLTSIDEALKNFHTTIPHLQKQIKEAKDKARCPSEHGLSKDEAAAIYIFTKQKNVYNMYHYLQAAMTLNNPSEIRLWFKYLRLLENGLQKLPRIKKKVWKATLHDPEVEKFLNSKKEKFYTTLAFWFLSKQAAETATNENFSDKFTHVCVNVDQAYDIRGYSADETIPCMIFPDSKSVTLQDSAMGATTFYYSYDESMYQKHLLYPYNS